MPVAEWHSGDEPPSPVYFDASILVASFATNDSRYKKASELFGALLVSNSEIVISQLTVSESLWGLAKTSYYQLYGHKSKVQFNPDIFRKNSAAIFAKYGARMHAVADWLHDWRASGINVTMLPPDMDTLEYVAKVAPTYMESLQLASADAVHLAVAELGAGSLVTTDRDFLRANSSTLPIFIVVA